MRNITLETPEGKEFHILLKHLLLHIEDFKPLKHFRPVNGDVYAPSVVGVTIRDPLHQPNVYLQALDLALVRKRTALDFETNGAGEWRCISSRLVILEEFIAVDKKLALRAFLYS